MPSIFTDALVPQCTTKTVSNTAATAVFSATQLVLDFMIQANAANTGDIYVGASNVDATACIRLDAGEKFSPNAMYAGKSNIREYDLSQWFIRGSASGQKASILKVRKAMQV